MRTTRTVLMLAGMTLAVTALATPRGASVFQRTYQIKRGTQLASKPCWACHTGESTTVKSLNFYGKAQRKLMRSKKAMRITPEILRALDKVDSDRDGYTNLAEIRADKSPGDPKSYPKRKMPAR